MFRFLRSGLTVRDGKRRRYGHLCTGNRRYRQHYLVISETILAGVRSALWCGAVSMVLAIQVLKEDARRKAKVPKEAGESKTGHLTGLSRRFKQVGV